MSFLAELRRRKVFQVAIGYLAVAWLLVQVTATILPAFDLPVWALRLIILLFALGFPIAVLMAWALELTPEGVKLDVSTSGRNRMLVIAAALMAVAVGWFFLGRVPPAQHAGSTAQAAAASTAPTRPNVVEHSIAVLPLVNASNDPEQQFFSDGLSENLIDTLSALVVSHTLLVFPFMFRAILVSAMEIKPHLEEASEILGAPPLRTFFSVVLPSLAPGITSGAIFAFIVSFDQFTISLFVTQSEQVTLPVALYRYVYDVNDPVAAAVSSSLVLFGLVFAIVLQKAGLLKHVGGRGAG